MVNISCWAQQRKAIYTMPFLIEKQLFEPKARFQHTYSTTVHWTPPIAPLASRIKALIFCGFGGRKPFAHPSWGLEARGRRCKPTAAEQVDAAIKAAKKPAIE
ncbi:hypothetical protein [Rhizobium giardinii]|uniref:hypothetical protein n=1 Tax=Rhizobium giardinii TaxID=56731 RepID=UPI003D6ECC40